jgi:hypothetical protein
MKDKDQRPTGDSTHHFRQQEQGIPTPKRTGGQQQSGFPHEEGGWGQEPLEEDARDAVPERDLSKDDDAEAEDPAGKGV